MTDTDRPTTYRQVGWQINGGVNDGKLVTDEQLEDALTPPHGGYSPVYIEVGD